MDPFELAARVAAAAASWPLRVYACSCALLTVVYFGTVYLLALDARSPQHLDPDLARKLWTAQCKKRSWVLTGTAALVSSICALPFTWDLVKSGLDVAQVRERARLSQAVVAFFMAYLNMDLVLGCLYYRKCITLLTGWIHHLGYSVLCIVVLQHRLTHVFSAAYLMESPTFLLALSMLVPATRNDIAFNALFFVTRIAWHAVLLRLYWSPYGLMHARGALEGDATSLYSIVPAVGFTLAAPLHIQWFTSSMRGMLKRRKLASQTSSPALQPQPPSPLLLPQRPRLVSLASSYLASPRPTLLRMRNMGPPRLSLSSSTFASQTSPSAATRRVAIERQVREFFDRRVRTNLPARTQRWLDRDSHDILKAHAVFPITRLRMRAGRGGDELRSLGKKVIERGRETLSSY